MTRTTEKDLYCYDCRFMKDDKKDCKILKALYCKLEPDKICSWYKKREKEVIYDTDNTK